MSISEVLWNNPFLYFLAIRGDVHSFTHGPFSISKPARSSHVLMLPSQRVSVFFLLFLFYLFFFFAFSCVFKLCGGCAASTLIEMFNSMCNLNFPYSCDSPQIKVSQSDVLGKIILSATSSFILSVWVGMYGLARGLCTGSLVLSAIVLRWWPLKKWGLVGDDWKHPPFRDWHSSPLNEFGVVKVGY